MAVIIRFFGRSVKREFAGRFFPSHSEFRFERPEIVEPQRGHANEKDERQRVRKFLVVVVPKDDTVPFLVEVAVNCRLDLVEIAHSLFIRFL